MLKLNWKIVREDFSWHAPRFRKHKKVMEKLRNTLWMYKNKKHIGYSRLEVFRRIRNIYFFKNSIYLVLLFAFLLISCNTKMPKKYAYTIGISYQNLQNEFILNIQDAVREKAKELNVKLIEVDGQGKAENQIAQVE